MKTIRLAGLSAIALTALLTAGTAWAGPGPHGGPGRGMKHMARELGLTADQKQQMLDIRSRWWRNGLEDAARAARDAHRNVQQVTHDPNATDDQVAAAVRSGTDATAQLAVVRHKMFKELQAVLTADQRAKFGELLQQRQSLQDRRFGAMDGFLSGGAD
jgi:Spy/CpxP family protein refolding chaperone